MLLLLRGLLSTTASVVVVWDEDASYNCLLQTMVSCNSRPVQSPSYPAARHSFTTRAPERSCLPSGIIII
ncbi:uncharacterized protein DMAD_11681 [Drosophila madeirensis]|uniref:Secreted protein n=1 Tax=Drosophila madeirensis TaxID=30013 RepID=A0AAU9FE65_DROMD